MQTTALNPPEMSIHPSRAEWEKLLHRVIESTPFRRAARLREFLLYVGNEVVLNGVEDLHEQQIGTAVFGRSPSYDTSQDNIVRVNAMELRKRIDLYFANEGRNEPLVFEIPRGSYAPVFRPRQVDRIQPTVEEPVFVEEIPVPVVQEIVPSHAATAPVVVAQPGRARVNLLQAGLLIIIACLAVALIVEVRKNQQTQMSAHKWQSGPALRDFWGNFFVPGIAPEIVIADNSFGIAQDVIHKQLSLAQYLDYSYRSADSPDPMSPEAREQQRKDLAVVFNRSTGSLGDFRVARRITELETGDYGTHLVFAREYTGHRLRWNNTVFVGSSRSNPWVELFEERMAYHFRQSHDSSPSVVVVDNPTGDEKAQYPISSDPATTLAAYCLIAFLPNPTNTGNTLIVAGTDSQATEAGGDFLTSEENLEKLQTVLHQKPFPHFQVLLRIVRSNGTPLGAEIISYRIVRK